MINLIKIKALNSAKKIAENCIGCNLCKKNCPMMSHHQVEPKVLFKQLVETGEVERELIYSCTGCDYCSQVCPKDLDIKAFCYDIKKQCVAEEKVYNKQGQFAVTNFHKASTHSFFTYLDHNVKIGEIDTVFLPGCSLVSSNPSVVQKIIKKMNKVEPVGLLIDCCGNPIYGLGDEKRFKDNVDRLMKLFNRYGIKRVVTACGNCYKTFSAFYDVEIIDLWQYIDQHSDVFIRKKKIEKEVASYILHDPCSYRESSSTHQAIRSVFSKMGVSVKEFDQSKELVPCCGAGGMMALMNPPLAQKVQKRRVEDAGTFKIVSYCQSCVDGFSQHGNDGTHILALIFDTEQESSRMTTPRRWMNRRLARKK